MVLFSLKYFSFAVCLCFEEAIVLRKKKSKFICEIPIEMELLTDINSIALELCQ